MSVIGTLLGGGAVKEVATGRTRFHLGLLDFDDPEGEAWSVEVGFLAHAFAAVPGRPGCYAMFEKHGPGCCIADLAGGEVLEVIPPGEGRQFYGHGAYSADGSLLYATETVIADAYRGVIAVRDAGDLRLRGEFPTYGRAPHDCVLVDGGSTLVVTNGGSALARDEPASVTWVDVKSEALLERVEIPDPKINAGHIAITEAGELAVVSAPRDGESETARGGVTIGRRGGPFRTLTEPAEVCRALTGETLSVAIHEPSGIVGTTTPLAHYVLFWELATGKLVHSLRVPNPRGIAVSLSGDEFIVNWGEPPRAARVSAETLRPVDVPGNQRGRLSLATGSHIAMIPRPTIQVTPRDSRS